MGAAKVKSRTVELKRYVSGFLDVLNGAALWVSGAMLFAILVLMNLEVALRYIFHGSTHISEEYAGYVLACISVLCFSPALRRDRFLQVQSVVRTLPYRFQAVQELAAGLVGATLAAVLTYSSTITALNSWRFGSVSLQYSKTPLFIPQMIVALCLAVLVICSVEHAVSRCLQLWRGEEPVEHGYDVD